MAQRSNLSIFLLATIASIFFTSASAASIFPLESATSVTGLNSPEVSQTIVRKAKRFLPMISPFVFLKRDHWKLYEETKLKKELEKELEKEIQIDNEVAKDLDKIMKEILFFKNGFAGKPRIF